MGWNIARSDDAKLLPAAAGFHYCCSEPGCPMKIYLNQNNQKLGPYSQEEARNLVYSGDVPRSVPACYEGGSDWVPLDSLLTPPEVASRTAVPPPIPMSIERLRDPKEKTALLWLYVAAIPGSLLLLA